MTDQNNNPPADMGAPTPVATGEITIAPGILPIPLDEYGVAKPTTFVEAYQIAQMYQRSKLVPKHYENTMQVLAAMQAGAQLRLPPLTAIKSFAPIEGVLALHTDGPLAAVKASGLLAGLEEWYIDDDGNKLTGPLAAQNATGAFCRSKRKGDNKWVETGYTLKMAAEANLYPARFRDGSPNPKGPWSAHKAVMLKRRARTTNFKDNFADVLGGVFIAEYDDLELRSDDDRRLRIQLQEDKIKTVNESLDSRSSNGETKEPLDAAQPI